METKVRKFSYLSNFIFLASTMFCLAFLWCNYYIKNIKISLISSIIITISILIISISIKQMRGKKLQLKKSNAQAFENFKLHLQYCQNSEILEIICCPQILNKLQAKSPYHYHTNIFDIFILLNTDDIFKAFNERTTNNIIIVTNRNVDIPFRLENLQIKLVNENELYALAKEKDLKFGVLVNHKKTKKYSPKDVLCILLCKEKSKSYFSFALLLLFSSLFTPFGTYYIIFSTFFFVLSLFCRFNKFFN